MTSREPRVSLKVKAHRRATSLCQGVTRGRDHYRGLRTDIRDGSRLSNEAVEEGTTQSEPGDPRFERGIGTSRGVGVL